MNIDKDLLSEMGACNSGMRWFLKNFEGDAQLKDVITLLLREGRDDDSAWLNRHLLMRADTNVKAFTETNVETLIEYTGADLSDDRAQIGSSHNCAKIGSSDNLAQIATTSYNAKIGSSGDYTQIVSGGNCIQIASSGNYTQIASSGDSTKIASSGDSTQIASSGTFDKIASSGDSPKIATTGYDAKIQAQGANAVITITGSGMAKAGDGGVIAIRWHDEQNNRSRIAVGYVGEDLKADTWYEVKKGKFIEATK